MSPLWKRIWTEKAILRRISESTVWKNADFTEPLLKNTHSPPPSLRTGMKRCGEFFWNIRSVI